MAIREFSPAGMQGSRRAKIAFVGQMPSGLELRQFEIRKFKCEEWTVEKLSDLETVAQLDAVIWTQKPDKLIELPRQLKSVVRPLLNNDVRVYIRPASKRGARKAVVDELRENRIPPANLFPEEWRTLPPDLQEREGSNFMPCVFIFDANEAWPNIATIVCDRPSGPRPRLKLQFDTSSLVERFGPDAHAELILLLQRAFWNCSELSLCLLKGGLSGAAACKAYATLEAGLVPTAPAGAYPHLYFIKIGPRKKIADEYDNYVGHFLEYVPFHLGPRLRLERCNLGSRYGILVGDFVDATESLVACAREGRCGQAISNLFDRTLAGWRKQALPDTQERTLSGLLAAKWQDERSDAQIALPPSRAEFVKALGGTTKIEWLKRTFDEYGASTPRCGPAHGDMHATNVLVRHGDAIIIDFEKMQPYYPLTYDPASLEGGLLVEGFTNDLKQRKGKRPVAPNELAELLKPLYTLDALLTRIDIPCQRGSLVEWYFDCINQIRMRSWSGENPSGQYALTLALCLIRKGCNEDDTFSNEQDILRAIAFYFGQSILREIASRRGLKIQRKAGKER